MKKQTPWEEIVLRTKEHTQCTCTQLSVFCENPGSLVKTRHRCSELWGSLVFWASPSFKCLFSGLISLSHLCINGECVSVCPGLQWGILDSAVLGACTLDGCELNICADCCQVSSSSGYIRKRSLCRSILLAGDCSVFRCSEGPAGCSHRCCGSGVLWGWVRSLVWGAEHCPPQRGAALVTWLWPHSCPRSCHSNHWHVSGVCTAQPGCFPSSAWIVQAGKDPLWVWAGEYHAVTGENFARTSQWFLEFWIYSFPCFFSALPQTGHVCGLFFFLCLSSCSSNVSVSWQLLFLVLFEIIQDSRRVSLTRSRGNKYIKWP